MLSLRRAVAALTVLLAAACSETVVGEELTGTGPTDSIPKPEPEPNASLVGRRPYPDDNPWNTVVAGAPVDPRSAQLLASCGMGNLHPDFGTVWNGAPNGIPYVLVRRNQPRVPVTFTHADESDPGPYPIPADAPVEGGSNGTGDRHVIVVDIDDWKLYELWDARPEANGARWRAGSGAVFDLTSNALRPAGWTSADAAGLPIFPGLVRYDEVVERGAIEHALRFTCPRTRRAYVHPARHWASSDTSSALPPMGMRVRLRPDFDTTSYPREARVILRAMMRYGMLLADHGTAWYVSGAPDPRWNEEALGALRRVPGSAFEVVRMDGMVRP